jgi:branched-chain amino acid transport system substrate-binding protein
MDALEEHVYSEGLSDAENVNGVFYQRGLVISMILAEGIRTAQQMHDTDVIDGPMLRDGLENLEITEERLAELGMTGMVPPFSTSCANHTGSAGGWMLEWDGEKFVQASELLSADQELIAPLVERRAQEYAESNAPWPMNEDCQPES